MDRQFGECGDDSLPCQSWLNKYTGGCWISVIFQDQSTLVYLVGVASLSLIEPVLLEEPALSCYIPCLRIALPRSSRQPSQGEKGVKEPMKRPLEILSKTKTSQSIMSSQKGVQRPGWLFLDAGAHRLHLLAMSILLGECQPDQLGSRRWLIRCFLDRVYETYYLQTFLSNHSPSDVAWIGAIQAFAQFSAAMVSGPIADRHGAMVCMT